MNKLHWLIIIGQVIASVAYASHEIIVSQQQIRQLGITLAPVEAASSLTTDRLPGQVVIPPQQERVVSAPYAGLIVSMQSALSDDVNKGQVLAELESPGLVSLQREFLQALTDANLVKTNFIRDETLFKEGIIAERRYLETKGQYEQTLATVNEKKQTLKLAGMSQSDIQTLEKTRSLSSNLKVTAPISGVVLEAIAKTGQRVDTAQPLYRIAKLEPLWLEIKVPVDRMQGIAVGTAVETPCPGVSANVTLIGKNVNPESQTLLVRAEVSGDDRGVCLHPGQFVQLRLKLATTQARFRVPSTAIVRSSNQYFVFVHIPAGFEPRQVEVVGKQANYTVISGGALSTSERVAISGLAAIKAAWMGIGGGE